MPDYNVMQEDAARRFPQPTPSARVVPLRADETTAPAARVPEPPQPRPTIHRDEKGKRRERPLRIPEGWTVADNGTLSDGKGAIGAVLWLTGVVIHTSGEYELRVQWDGGKATLTAKAMSDSRFITELAPRGFPVAEDQRRDYSRWLFDQYR